MKKLLLVSVLAVILASCAGTSAQKQQDDIAVIERAEEFVGAMYHQDIGKVLDLMIPSNRNSRISGADMREEFIRQRKGEFENFRITDYDSSKLIVLGEKHAVTQAEITYKFREGDQTHSETICAGTFWLKFLKGWYWHSTMLPCDYMPSADEIEQLTRDLR